VLGNFSTGHRDRWNLVIGVGAVIHFAAHAYQFGNAEIFR
jgi:hypothetical protein